MSNLCLSRTFWIFPSGSSYLGGTAFLYDTIDTILRSGINYGNYIIIHYMAFEVFRNEILATCQPAESIFVLLSMLALLL